MLTNSRLKIGLYVLIAVIATASLWPGANLHASPLGAYIGHGWAHFLLYAAAASLALLGWKHRTGLAVSLGIAILSVGLQILRGMLGGCPTDIRALVTNLLGIAAGALLGLNILILSSSSRQQSTADADGSVSTQP